MNVKGKYCIFKVKLLYFYIIVFGGDILYHTLTETVIKRYLNYFIFTLP